jgi:hypothetical protein
MFALFAMISAVSAVSAMSAMFRQSRAKGDSEGENDRKERFHSTKYSLLPRRMRLSRRAIAALNRRFKLSKRRQLFIRVRNEAFSVATMRVSGEDGSPARINR